MFLLNFCVGGTFFIISFCQFAAAINPVLVPSTISDSSNQPALLKMDNPAKGVLLFSCFISLGAGFWFCSKGFDQLNATDNEDEGGGNVSPIIVNNDFNPVYNPTLNIQNHTTSQATEQNIDEQKNLNVTVHAQTISNKENSMMYQARSQEEEYAYLYDLLYENALGIVSPERGAGKTSFLYWVMQEHIKLGHKVEFVNPLAPAGYYQGIKVWGRRADYNDVAIGITTFVDELQRRIDKRADERYIGYNPVEDEVHYHLALDELTGYGTNLPKEFSMNDFWTNAIQLLRQANASISFASHGTTLVNLGGSEAAKGRSDQIKTGIVWVKPQAMTDRNVPGNKRPSGVAILEMPSQKPKQIRIPNWVREINPTCDYRQLIEQYCPHLALPGCSFEFSSEIV